MFRVASVTFPSCPDTSDALTGTLNILALAMVWESLVFDAPGNHRGNPDRRLDSTEANLETLARLYLF